MRCYCLSHSASRRQRRTALASRRRFGDSASGGLAHAGPTPTDSASPWTTTRNGSRRAAVSAPVSARARFPRKGGKAASRPRCPSGTRRAGLSRPIAHLPARPTGRCRVTRRAVLFAGLDSSRDRSGRLGLWPRSLSVLGIRPRSTPSWPRRCPTRSRPRRSSSPNYRHTTGMLQTHRPASLANGSLPLLSRPLGPPVRSNDGGGSI